jgi:hypothetical protein
MRQEPLHGNRQGGLESKGVQRGGGGGGRWEHVCKTVPKNPLLIITAFLRQPERELQLKVETAAWFHCDTLALQQAL